ncbi:DUF3098 domain-containing protein [Flaviaesturariibacter flavus]|uniref:DUF3098 domain-containing protein n=1 Tax=Flaviaesturariibacter flavus TaxID=2502780 RepID=A0A4R1BMY9_9BACT|nr:DUF3098 domain-containing protein [Flaviaesturariibacter flavus]TCJ18834.1 DUF3098 domain-containing protein [Flaviaesturariibacter flavus]
MATSSSTTTRRPAAREELHLSDKPLFGRENLMWMGIGAAVIILGFLLMAGGRSEDPNVFNKDEVYGFRRITLAPIVILAGLVIEIYALFRKSATPVKQNVKEQ